jgi:hypothetical protein
MPEGQMAENESKENDKERESRLLLNTCLTTVDPLLDRLLAQFVLDSKEVTAHRAGQQLAQIWSAARERLRAVVRSIRIGLSKTRRKALEQVGMFGDSLAAKWELLSFDVREGAVKRILKRLNSMLSSLSKVFPSLHAVKEFKDHLEVTLEALREPLEFISFGDLLKPQPR